MPKLEEQRIVEYSQEVISRSKDKKEVSPEIAILQNSYVELHADIDARLRAVNERRHQLTQAQRELDQTWADIQADMSRATGVLESLYAVEMAVLSHKTKPAKKKAKGGKK